jgi:hypothetical protein
MNFFFFFFFPSLHRYGNCCYAALISKILLSLATCCVKRKVRRQLRHWHHRSRPRSRIHPRQALQNLFRVHWAFHTLVIVITTSQQEVNRGKGRSADFPRCKQWRYVGRVGEVDGAESKASNKDRAVIAVFIKIA